MPLFGKRDQNRRQNRESSRESINPGNVEDVYTFKDLLGTYVLQLIISKYLH